LALTQLTPGKALQKEDKPFYEVPLLYGGKELTKLRVDSKTLKVLPAGEPAEGQAGPPGAREPKEGQESRLIQKNLVVPLGWVAALVAISSSLYYSWKRSMFGPIRAMSGEAKARVIQSLRKTLWYHIAFGLIALAVAVLHVVNFWGKLRLSVSWLTLGMMVTVVLSGAFGKFGARSDLVRLHWRRFHVPYTILFFLVLAIHIIMKLGLAGDG